LDTLLLQALRQIAVSLAPLLLLRRDPFLKRERRLAGGKIGKQMQSAPPDRVRNRHRRVQFYAAQQVQPEFARCGTSGFEAGKCFVVGDRERAQADLMSHRNKVAWWQRPVRGVRVSVKIDEAV
jgi:hypothetical protein